MQNVEYSIYNTSNDITPKSSMYCRSNQIQHQKLYIESQKAVSFGISRAFNTHRTSKSLMYCKRTPFEHRIFDIEFDLTVPLGNDTLKTSFQLNNKHKLNLNNLTKDRVLELLVLSQVPPLLTLSITNNSFRANNSRKRLNKVIILDSEILPKQADLHCHS